jgi:hypothetical protein
MPSGSEPAITWQKVPPESELRKDRQVGIYHNLSSIVRGKVRIIVDIHAAGGLDSPDPSNLFASQIFYSTELEKPYLGFKLNNCHCIIGGNCQAPVESEVLYIFTSRIGLTVRLPKRFGI